MMDVDEPASTQSSEFIDSQMLEEAPVLVFPESLLGTTKPLKVGELTLLLKVIKKGKHEIWLLLQVYNYITRFFLL